MNYIEYYKQGKEKYLEDLENMNLSKEELKIRKEFIINSYDAYLKQIKDSINGISSNKIN